jgi:hypothetical protein
MVDPHNRESLIIIMAGVRLNATQVINLLGFTETTSGEHVNRIEIYIKIQIFAFFLKELPGFSCIFWGACFLTAML